ncbi:hypothetical protein [Haladaptatus sp. DFWS20]|uniref:hypothetical protein n=1 Tax=Haladaptatus sp. DFWS20 TaxID=3403467 RepID=UPI003EB7E577
MNRREFISAAVAVSGTLLSGCVGETEATKLEQAPESAIKISTIKESNSENVSKISGHLESGEFEGMNFWGKTGYTLEWDIEVKGGPIDVWVMEQNQLKAFRDRGEIMYSRGVSEFGVKSGKAFGTMQPGKQMIVFENSGVFNTTPEGAVDFDATVRMLFQ